MSRLVSLLFYLYGLRIFDAFVGAQLVCPDGFTQDCGERCYRLFYVARNWDGAENYCESYNSSLASIRSEEEQFCVSSMRNFTLSDDDRSDAHYWIGLTSDHENVTHPLNWKWVDSSVQVGNGSFDYWAYVGDLREPNNEDGSERCGAMVFAEAYRIDRSGPYFDAWGVWNNAPCYETKHFICEARKIPVSLTSNTTAAETVDSDAPNSNIASDAAISVGSLAVSDNSTSV